MFEINKTMDFTPHSLMAFCVLCLALITGCSPTPPEPLRIATNVWPGYEPLYLARELGYYDSAPVRLVEHAAATDVIRAYRNGAIDAAALTLDEVLLLAQHGLRPKIVLVMDFSHGGDTLIAQSELTELSALQGRRIGVESSALGAYMLQRTLEHAGISHTDIHTVSVPADQHERAFSSKQIDAVVTFEPVRSKLLRQGANELFDSSRIPGEIVDVLVVRESYLQQHPDIVEAVLKGWFQALDYQASSPQRSAAIMAQREGLSVEDFTASLSLLQVPTLDGNLEQLYGPEALLKNTAGRLQHVMIEHKLQEKSIELDSLFHPDIVKAIAAEGQGHS